MIREEELPILQNDSSLPQTSQSSSKNYVTKLCITINILTIWSIAQGIISFHIGSTFNSPCLIAFGISSFAQIIIILYIYYKLLTEHYKTIVINIRNYFDSRKKTEKLIAIFGMITFIILAIIIAFIAFYANKKENDHPKKPLPPGTIPPFRDDEVNSRSSWQFLAFGVYSIHPYIILIFSTWHLSISRQSDMWKEATIWAGLFFPIAYIIFINSQLQFRKLQEVIFTLIIAVMFLGYATKLGWTYLWKDIGNIESEISYSSEIEDLEEQ